MAQVFAALTIGVQTVLGRPVTAVRRQRGSRGKQPAYSVTVGGCSGASEGGKGQAAEERPQTYEGFDQVVFACSSSSALVRRPLRAFWRPCLTEIYLCGVCSCPEILSRNGRGQAALGNE
eukprot:COSAG01_NODE_26519_length_711_cov_1.573529_1_plen_119_part_10